MQQMINDPAAFIAGGWTWLWELIAHVDGRFALAAGICLWFVVERLAGSIYDPLKKVVVVLAVAGGLLGAATVWAGFRAASGPAPSFESLWTTPGMDQYRRLR